MKTIDGFPNYTIDYDGVVKSNITGKTKATRHAGKGYQVVDIYNKASIKYHGDYGRLNEIS